jgi:hypothetical protein
MNQIPKQDISNIPFKWSESSRIDAELELYYQLHCNYIEAEVKYLSLNIEVLIGFYCVTFSFISD